MDYKKEYELLKKKYSLLQDSISSFKMMTITSIKKDELDTLRDIINMYGLFKFKKKLEPREIAVMSFYLKYGYSNSTKNKIINFLEIKRKHLTQINYKLTKKKLLINGVNKKQNKELSNDMRNIQQYVKSGEKQLRFLLLIEPNED
jgi:hypothetical protein